MAVKLGCNQCCSFAQALVQSHFACIARGCLRLGKGKCTGSISLCQTGCCATLQRGFHMHAGIVRGAWPCNKGLPCLQLAAVRLQRCGVLAQPIGSSLYVR